MKGERKNKDKVIKTAFLSSLDATTMNTNSLIETPFLDPNH